MHEAGIASPLRAKIRPEPAPSPPKSVSA